MGAKKLSIALSKDELAFEVIKNSFDTLILSVPVSGKPDISVLNPVIVLESGTGNLKDTYRIHNIEVSKDNSFILLAEAVTKEHKPSKSGGRYVDKVYSCNMYGVVLADTGKIEFYGNFPEDKRHEHLTKDLAKAVVDSLA